MNNNSKKFSEEDNIINDMEVINLEEELEDKEPDGSGLVPDEDSGILCDTKEQEDTIKESRSTASRREEEQFDIKKEIRSWIFTLALTFALIFVLKNYVIINAMVPTGSMENTIMPEDQLFGNRLAYVSDEPKRGDVIFFYYPDDESQKFVKRIIGLPGEKVTITDAKIYIDDSEVPLDEPYLKEEWIYGTGPYEFQVPEGCYFVLGDNRNTSQDARYWENTYVKKEKIIGKAVFIYYPFDRMGVVE